MVNLNRPVCASTGILADRGSDAQSPEWPILERTALILFAHGARNPNWVEPMSRVRTAVCHQLPQLRVELAFLEFMKPDLVACARSLVAAGCQRIVVLPLFIASGGHLQRDLPRLVDELRRCHPLTRFELAGAVGEAGVVVEAMASHARALVVEA